MPSRPSEFTSRAIRRSVERLELIFKQERHRRDPIMLEGEKTNTVFGDALDLFDNFFNVPNRFRKEMREDFA